jgi:trk system potassium uptake protein TrkA
MGQFAVIGLGRFGAATSMELMKLGHSVLGIDVENKAVDTYADRLTRAAVADVTDRNAVEELGLNDYDVVLVAIGSDLQASLVSVVHLKAVGVKEIWVKATSRAHHLILSKLGVSRIIHPEEEMGTRIAQALSYPMVNDYIPLGNGEFVVEIEVSKQLDGRALDTILGRSDRAIHALAVKRRAETTVHPPAHFVLRAQDLLILLGQLQDLKTAAPKLA